MGKKDKKKDKKKVKTVSSEQLMIYNLDSKWLGVEDRGEFYEKIEEEFRKTGKIMKKIKAVKVIFMNSEGKICLQRRSSLKSQNAGMFDKTFGGHISANNSEDMTVIMECAQELGLSMNVFSNEEFVHMAREADLSVMGVFQKVDYVDCSMSTRVYKDGTSIIQPQMVSIYIGYYDGGVNFIDGECSGIQFFTLDELKSDIKKKPDEFTEDIKTMVEDYAEYLVPLAI